ncbi:MAG: STAS domain-containing protein [Actinomycetota bacterium]
MALGITIEEAPRLFAIEVAGDLDLGSIPGLHDALQKATLTTCPDVALDLDGLTSIDDAALGILHGALRRLNRVGRRIWIVCNLTALIDRLERAGILDSAEVAASRHDIASH